MKLHPSSPTLPRGGRELISLASLLLPVAVLGCHRHTEPTLDASAQPVVSAPEMASAPPIPGGMTDRVLGNRYAYIPAQCYTKTRDGAGKANNPCYACHIHSDPPNFVEDADLQLQWSFHPLAAKNHWSNLFDPPVARAPRERDEDVLAYVRQRNYFDAEGKIALARTLSALPKEWDGSEDGKWDGYIPDAWFSFDNRGYDHRPDGTPTGWRAFAYAPFLGTFFPTNGSFDDVLVRLDPMLREDRDGHPDQRIYEINLAIVSALVARADVAIEPVDENIIGVDLDLDGKLGRATRVTFDKARMHWAGRASQAEPGRFPIVPGLFPLGTEFLHSVRYLDVEPHGGVVMAPRMKELRYAKKVRWYSVDDLRKHAASEIVEQAESADGALPVLWQIDRGIYNNQGWLFQGFIEAADGALRPQSYEETVYCAGCHGEIGRTTDSIFSFPRKRGYYHWTQHDLHGMPEPRTRDGQYEYTQYLRENGAGDELRENREVMDRFFDARGNLRPNEVALLHKDISTLLLPSAARALDLNRAYHAIVREQTFARGRDTVLAPSSHVYADAPRGEKTGIARAIR
ncbi:hypothetical protein LVJ94_47000 [Pendulispora rubella]|uniref:Lipoprotein n=1 Tax=Pendulispora rubella TaxID=2741070 RepID=A0ABZ2L4E6_9BACT